MISYHIMERRLEKVKGLFYLDADHNPSNSFGFSELEKLRKAQKLALVLKGRISGQPRSYERAYDLS